MAEMKNFSASMPVPTINDNAGAAQPGVWNVYVLCMESDETRQDMFLTDTPSALQQLNHDWSFDIVEAKLFRLRDLVEFVGWQAFESAKEQASKRGGRLAEPSWTDFGFGLISIKTVTLIVSP
jgi:hypothetical protein